MHQWLFFNTVYPTSALVLSNIHSEHLSGLDKIYLKGPGYLRDQNILYIPYKIKLCVPDILPVTVYL